MKRKLLPIVMLVLSVQALWAQEGLTLDRIFNYEFYPRYPKETKWIDEGAGYTLLEKSETVKGQDIVKYSTAKDERSVLVKAADLVPAGAEEALPIENYVWSASAKYLMIYTNSKRVWRYNTKGDYWIKNLETGDLFQVGKGLPASSLMFAKISPDEQQVAYVSLHNLYVEDLASHKITQLTFDGSTTIINGTFDWVYEEEFGCRDGFRWSPDSKKLAYWQLDASPIKDFLMINNTDSIYSYTIPVQYPKVGEANSYCKVGVIGISGGETTWMKMAEDIQDNYTPRMEWADNASQLIIQQMNRPQNTNNVYLCDAATGAATKIFTDQDETWVDAIDDWMFFNKGQQFTWVSQKDGWKKVYAISRDGKNVSLMTPGDFDVISIQLIDVKKGWIYFIASPDNATQRYLYRSRINGKGTAQRLTPADLAGTNSYNISPDGKYAFHTYSKAGKPPVSDLVALPSHTVIKTLEDNQALVDKMATLGLSEQEFFSITTDEEVSFDCYMIKPASFDPDKKYPVLFHVYGEPAGQTVLDSWGGNNFFYHQLLAQQGYIVMSIDSRGTPAPKGRAWRKSIYGKIGVISSNDQFKVASEIIKQYPFVDGDRVGIWGWSGGGSMTLNMLFRYPELYKMGVSVAPVTHLALYDNVYQERYSGLLEDEEVYYNSSPVNFAENLQGKLLLIHGTGDDNVHYQNAEVLINELIKQNKQFQMMSYPNRSHGIYEGANTRRHLYTTMYQYIINNL